MDIQWGVPHEAVGEQHLCSVAISPHPEESKHQIYGQGQQEGRAAHHHGVYLLSIPGNPQPEHHKKGDGRKK